MFYGFGRAQPKRHGNLLLHLYGEARARGAEYWGESLAAQDRWLIAHGEYERSARWYKQQTPQFRADQLSFLAGKKLRVLWTTRAEVEANLEARNNFENSLLQWFWRWVLSRPHDDGRA